MLPDRVSNPYMCTSSIVTVIPYMRINRYDIIFCSFRNIEAKDKNTYFWNPCFPVSYTPAGRKHSPCVNVAVCMERQGFPQSLIYDTGTQHTAVFTTDSNGTLFLSYQADEGKYHRTTIIELRCSTLPRSDFLFADVENDLANMTTVYTLILLSKYACGISPTTTKPSTIVPLPAGNCTQVSACKCIFDDGSVIDLAPLSRNDGQPL